MSTNDVKATTLKLKKNKILHESYYVYGDDHNQEFNPNHRTNIIAIPILG